MNRLAQFLHYTQKVFGLKRRLRAVRDERPWAEIPTLPVLLSLVFGVVLRISSYYERRLLVDIKAAQGTNLSSDKLACARALMHPQVDHFPHTM